VPFVALLDLRESGAGLSEDALIRIKMFSDIGFKIQTQTLRSFFQFLMKVARLA
jgi:hypothetical protein